MLEPEENSRWPRFTLQPRDQRVIALSLALGFVCLGTHWLLRGGQRGDILEIDRIAPGQISYQVDLNKAEWTEFTILPGVGETLAKRIVDSREKQGPYRDIRDLERISGIGPRTVERLKPYLLPIANLEETAERATNSDPAL